MPEWDDNHKDYPQSINIERDDYYDDEENKEVTSRSWYAFRERVLDYIGDLSMELEYEDVKEQKENNA